MDTIVFPGSFDPITFGHLDLIKRASKLTNDLIVLVVNNHHNKIDINQRKNLIQKAIDDIGLKNVRVLTHDGLLIEFLKQHNYHIILRGIRNNNDYLFEQTLAINNQLLYEDIQTIYLLTSPKVLHISSSVVWELFNLKANISHLVPSCVEVFLKENYENL